MNKDIKYTGYSAVPSDYECPDGQLASSLNLLSEDEQLKPLSRPKVIRQMSADEAENMQRISFIHKTASYTHYILCNERTYRLYWMNAENGTPQLIDNVFVYPYSFSHINAVGNVLMVFNSTGITYILWKNNGYTVLGDKLPEISLSFGLIGHPRLYSAVTEEGSSNKRGTFNISFDKINEGNLHNSFTDSNKAKITSQVMAKVNKFIAEQTINKGRFCFPFFVRWAYRLFDGSHVMHSAPVLMTPSTTPAPVVFWKRATGKGGYTDAELDIMLVAADLDYCLQNTDDAYSLDKWSDIIDSIDIYISKPIYTYDQNGEFSSFNDEDNMESKFIGRLYNGPKNKDTPDTTFVSSITEDRMLAPIASTDFLKKYMEYTYAHIYALYFAADRRIPNSTLHMPEYSDSKAAESIENNSLFYKLASISFSELVRNERKKIDVGDEYLQSLTSREVMTDDYLTHDKLSATESYNFNSRLNISGVKRELFSGFNANAMFAYCQDVYSWSTNTSTNSVTVTPGVVYPNIGNMVQPDSSDIRIEVYIREDDGQVYCVSSENDYYMQAMLNFVFTGQSGNTYTLFGGSLTKQITYDWETGTKTTKILNSSGQQVGNATVESDKFRPTAYGSFLYYPNTKAFKIAIYHDVSWIPRLVFECDLKPHEFLNGSYAFLGFKHERGNKTGTLPEYTHQYDGNYVSVPNKVYTSEVNNPFYFPLNGINTVGAGKILGICSAAKALSEGQFGQFPLYAFTDEGVWAMELSSTGLYSARQPITRDVCINPDGITQIDSAVLFPTDRGIMLISGSQTQCISDAINTETPFDIRNLPGMQKLHDMLGHIDTNANPDKCIPTLPFLEFLKDCGMLYDYVHQRIIVYNTTCTYAYVYSLKSHQWGMIYSNIKSGINSYPDALAVDSDGNIVNFSLDNAEDVGGLLVTRPLKLDAPDIHKTIDTIIQRGNFRKGHVQSVLYGSRDLYSWHLVWSSKDHFLRGFRGTPYKYFRIALLCNLAPGESIFGASIQFTPKLNNQPR
ncbi:MAG: hypothetical protein NC453_17885 [Muribaculum sp.]|nr:hypothetical protein [Muribaculum sp.]